MNLEEFLVMTAILLVIGVLDGIFTGLNRFNDWNRRK